MKTTTTTVPNPFRPVSLTITFETQKELDFWGSLFNHARFSDAHREFTGHGTACDTYLDLQKVGANINKITEISDSFTKHFGRKF